MEIRHRKSKASKIPKLALAVILVVAICSGLAYKIIVLEDDSDTSNNTVSSFVAVHNGDAPPYNNNNNNNNGGVTIHPGSSRPKKNGLEIPVFVPVYSNSNAANTANENNGDTTGSSNPVTEKLMQDLQNSASVGEIIPLDVVNPPAEFLESCGSGITNGNGIAAVAAKFGASSSTAAASATAQERFAALRVSKQPHLAMELLKYCALEHHKGGLYLDSQSTLSSTLDHIVTKLTTKNNKNGAIGGANLAILNDAKISPDSIHGALLYMDKSSAKKTKSATVVEGMIHVLLSTDVTVLESSPLLLPKHLYDLIAKAMGVAQLSSKAGADWHFLQHTCNLFSLGQRELTTPISAYALNSHR
jgi:hypothetical protein